LSIEDYILVLKRIDVEKILKDIARGIAKTELDLEGLTKEVGND